MFNQTVLLHFTFFLASLAKTHKFYKRFVFLENSSDLISLHGLQYEQGEFFDANEHSITILGSRKIGFPQLFIINLLQQTINFKIQLYLNEQNWQHFVLVGIRDMNLMMYTSNLPYQSLHPTLSGSQQLFVVNMRMVGTPTYFIELFDVNLWIAFLTSFICIGVLSTSGICLLQRFTTTRYDCLSWFSILTNQGGDESNSQLIFPKILLVSLSVIAIIFHGLFSAFLSSYLAIRIPDIPFTNLDGLVKNFEYSICTPYGSGSYRYLNDYLNNSIDLTIKNHRVNNKNCPKEFTQHKVSQQHDTYEDFCPMDNTVFFLTSVFDMSNEKCPAFKLIALNEKYAKQYYSILVSPGFKYREQFNRGLIRLLTTGLIKRSETQFHRRANNIESRLGQSDYNPTIDIGQTKIILLIPAVGIFLGSIILLIEILNQ